MVAVPERLLAYTGPDAEMIHLRGPSLFGRKVILVARPHFSIIRHVVPDGSWKSLRAIRETLVHRHGVHSPEFLVMNDGDHPGSETEIWYWDRAKLDTDPRLRNLFILPEPVAWKGAEDGARIVQGIDGYTGEVWSGKKCVARQWWQLEPSEAQWSQFCIGGRSSRWPTDQHGNPLQFNRPSVQPAEWVQPRNLKGSQWFDLMMRVSPKAVALSLVILASFPIAYELTGVIASQQEVERLLKQEQDLRASSEDWIRDRRQTLTDSNVIDQLASFGDPGALLFALLDFSSALDVSKEARVSRIEVSDQTVRVTVNGISGAQIIEVIRSLENSTNWTSVRYDASGGVIVGEIEDGTLR